MSSSKSSAWCIVKECNKNVVEKKHFFRFPKEYDRWLQWIRACERLDLEAIGAEYVHHNYRVCHLHFEEKWYKISKTRTNLQPDAVPTIFFGRNNTSITSEEEKMDENVEEKSEEENINIFKQDKTNSDLQSKSFLSVNEIQSCDKDVQIAKSTSSSARSTKKEESPQKKKLRQRKYFTVEEES